MQNHGLGRHTDKMRAENAIYSNDVPNQPKLLEYIGKKTFLASLVREYRNA